MLERQQTQLVAGLQALYRKLIEDEPWDGKRVPEYDNRPRTHDILAALGLVQPPKHAESQVQEFQEQLLSTGGDDANANLVSMCSGAENHLSTSYDCPDPMQTDAWTPSFEAELSNLLHASKQDWNQEKEAVFLQSLETTQPTTVPSRPDIVPQDCMSMNYTDPLLYRPEWMLGDEICGLGGSVSPLVLPAHLQSFEFNVNPTELSTKATYSRRGQTM